MYQNYYMPRSVSYKSDRFVPFAGPFLLGALTGGVAVGAVGAANNRPRPYPYRPYPYGNYGYGYGYGAPFIF